MVGFESNISTNDKKKKNNSNKRKIIAIYNTNQHCNSFTLFTQKENTNTKNLLSTQKPIFGKIALTLLDGSIDIVAIIVFVIINMVYC